MSRYRLIFEGDFSAEDGTEGIAEQIAMCVEPIGDVRLVKVVDVLAGCGVCQHGIPVEGSFYTKVKCNSRGAECVRDATDHCMRFVRLNIMDRSVLSDAKIAKEYERRIEKFNRLVAQDR